MRKHGGHRVVSHIPHMPTGHEHDKPDTREARHVDRLIDRLASSCGTSFGYHIGCRCDACREWHSTDYRKRVETKRSKPT